MIHVQTREQAQSIGYMWAVTRGMDAVLFSQLAESIFQENKGKPFTQEMLETSMHHYANAAGRESAFWANYASRSWNLQSQWSIETARHLAIVSVAGIAGTAALLQKSPDSTRLSMSLALFAIALLAAVLQFWLVQEGLTKRAETYDLRADAIRSASSWKDYVAIPRDHPDSGGKWFSAATWAGWASAAISIVAVAGLIMDIGSFC